MLQSVRESVEAVCRKGTHWMRTIRGQRLSLVRRRTDGATRSLYFVDMAVLASRTRTTRRPGRGLALYLGDVPCSAIGPHG